MNSFSQNRKIYLADNSLLCQSSNTMFWRFAQLKIDSRPDDDENEWDDITHIWYYDLIAVSKRFLPLPSYLPPSLLDITIPTPMSPNSSRSWKLSQGQKAKVKGDFDAAVAEIAAYQRLGLLHFRVQHLERRLAMLRVHPLLRSLIWGPRCHLMKLWKRSHSFGFRNSVP